MQREEDEEDSSIPVPELSQLHQRPIAQQQQEHENDDDYADDGDYRSRRQDGENNPHNPSSLQENEFASAALLLRMGTFRRNAKRLYTFFQGQVLEWPSLSVTWMAERKRTTGFRDFSLQSVVVGTQALDVAASTKAARQAAEAQQRTTAAGAATATSAGAAASASSTSSFMNYLSCIEMSVPVQVEDLDVLAQDDSDNDDNPLNNLDNIAYKQVRGHSRMSQFVGLGSDAGAVLRIRRVFEGYNRQSVAIRTSKSADIRIYHFSRRDRVPFSTDPELNMPDLILTPEGCPATMQMSRRRVRPGFGLASSPCEEQMVVAGGEDGALIIWQVPELLLERFGTGVILESDSSSSSSSSSSDDDDDDDEEEKGNDVVKERDSGGRGGSEAGSASRARQRRQKKNSAAARAKRIKKPSAITLPPRAILDTGTGSAISDVSCHSSQPHLVVAATEAGDAILYDLRMMGGSPSGAGVIRHAGGVNAAQFHPTAQFQVATGGNDGSVKLWDIRAWKGKSVATYRYHTAAVTSVAWAPHSDRVFASGGEDGLVCLWNMGRGLEVYQPPESQSQSADAASSNTERGGGAAVLPVPRELCFVHCGHVSPITDVQWNPSSTDEWTVASVDQSNLLQVWRPCPTAVSAQVFIDGFDKDEFEYK